MWQYDEIDDSLTTAVSKLRHLIDDLEQALSQWRKDESRGEALEIQARDISSTAAELTELVSLRVGSLE